MTVFRGLLSWVLIWGGDAALWMNERSSWRFPGYQMYHYLMLWSSALQITDQEGPSWRGPWEETVRRRCCLGPHIYVCGSHRGRHFGRQEIINP